MSQKKGLFGKMLGGLGGMPGKGGMPSEAEMAKMQAELAQLDPKALEALSPELRDMVSNAGSRGAAETKPESLPARALPGLGGRLPGLPGLGGGRLPGLSGLPGLPGKRK
jgi:signal recognition particle subunit SRP54